MLFILKILTETNHKMFPEDLKDVSKQLADGSALGAGLVSRRDQFALGR